MGCKEKLYYGFWKWKYRKYPLASGFREMIPFADWIKTYSDLKINNIFEIGANYGQDAETLRHCFRLQDKDVYVFEAHPDIYRDLRKLHKFNAYHFAVCNKTGTLNFNICDVYSGNSGVSTLLKDYKRGDSFKKITVNAIRMDEFMNKNNISRISFLKLDVEGATWEVLDGFGDRIKDIDTIHIEAEHIEEYEGETLWGGVRSKLEENGFEMIFFQRYKKQSDSFWIQKKHMNS